MHTNSMYKNMDENDCLADSGSIKNTKKAESTSIMPAKGCQIIPNKKPMVRSATSSASSSSTPSCSNAVKTRAQQINLNLTTDDMLATEDDDDDVVIKEEAIETICLSSDDEDSPQQRPQQKQRSSHKRTNPNQPVDLQCSICKERYTSSLQMGLHYLAHHCVFQSDQL